MLEHFFGSNTRVKLLQIFFRAPESRFYVRELTRLAQIQLHAVRRELANLERLGLIFALPAAPRGGEIERAKYFQANEASPLFSEVRALLVKAAVLEEQALVASLQSRGGVVSLFILTGQFTGDREAPTDVFLVGKLKPLVISRVIREYEANSGKAVRYTLLSEAEWRDRREIGDKFLYSVLEAKHVTVVDKYHVT